MTNNRGFTLIELTVVIVILGILAVTAAPRFLNLQRDAKIASIMGVKASMEDAARLAYAKAVIEGVENNPRTTAPEDVQNDGTPSAFTNLGYLELKMGRPEARAEHGLGIIELTDIAGTERGKQDLEICYSRDCGSENSSVVRVGYDFPNSYDVDDKPGATPYMENPTAVHMTQTTLQIKQSL
ncbi:type II secretion system protein [Vibrio comitans]